MNDEATERPLVVFSLDGQRYALPLDRVRRSIRAVAVTPLPEAPEIVLGIIDLGGEVLPVIDVRKRFGHPPREIRLSDHFVVADTGRRTVALLVDEANGVIEVASERCSAADEILPGMELIDGAVRLEDGLILIHDLERLLSLEEEKAIGRALVRGGGRIDHGPEASRCVLQARARAAAKSPAVPDDAERLEVLAFSLAGESFAVETCHVREACQLKELTPVPCTPPFVAGVMSLRGRIIAIIDLRRFFDLPARGITELNRVIVLVGGGDEFGLLADSIDGVRSVPVSDLQEGLPTLTGVRDRFLKGITGQMLAVLDGERLLADAGLKVNEQIAR